MGYHTSFNGSWDVTPPLTPYHNAYLRAFAESRRQRYHEAVVEALPDPARVAAGLPLGPQGAFFVNDKVVSSPWRLSGLELEPPSLVEEKVAVADANHPPDEQPGLWCGWRPVDDGASIEGEDGKFYDYIEWAKYIVEKFIVPWGYKLNGTIEWFGEEDDDRGRLNFTDNTLEVEEAHVVWKTSEAWRPGDGVPETTRKRVEDVLASLLKKESPDAP